MRILGFDPGGSTGWSYFEDENKVAGGAIHDGLTGFLAWSSLTRWIDQATMIVVENFVVKPEFVGVPEASEVIGSIITQACCPVYRQMPSQKATLVKGTEVERFAWLRAHGFNGSTSHELDADTHVLLRLRAMNHRPTLQKYWGI